jgi:methyl-accepting chemotaxis protein
MSSLRRSLFLLVTAGLASCVLVAAVASWGKHLERQATERQLTANEVTADILPPPLYLVELRLVLGMAVDGSMPLAEAQSEAQRLGKEHADRVAYYRQHTALEGLETQLLGPQLDAAQRLLAAAPAVFAAVEKADAAAARQQLAAAHKIYLEHRAGIDQTVKQASAKATEAASARLHAANMTHALAAGVLVLAFALLLAIGRQVRRQVFRTAGGEPAEVTRIANAVAMGDLTVKVNVHPGDQTSAMAAMGRMCESLATLVQTVRASSSSIASGSEQIAAGNADLATRTERNAAELQQTASAMEQFSGAVQQTADAAGQACRLAEAATGVAVRGADVVGQVVQTMQDISVSSRQIGEITSVIDGIAFQTNILALNAAVEAARAGEQGRGFAVVASEVRSLAQRSAAAAKQINGLISGSIAKVQSGSQLVTQAGATMQDIVGQVQRVSDLIVEISNAAQEQTGGLRMVGSSITQLDSATQQNAALVEEAAAAAGTLSQQASELQSVVERYQVAAAA